MHWFHIVIYRRASDCEPTPIVLFGLCVHVELCVYVDI